MRAIKITGIIVLSSLAILAGVYLFIKFKSTNIEDKKNLERSIDIQVTQFIAKGNAYGVVVGVVKDDKVYLKGFGTTEKGKNILPDSTTIFELASTSKLFTTSTLQLLIDEDELKLDDPIKNLLNGKVTFPANAQKTTLRHLATHRSGFPSLPNSFIAKMTDDSNPYKDLVTQDIYDYLKSCEGKKAEGIFDYSNFGMGLLGHLLELKTDVKYEQLVKEKLLKPLGMTQTFVTVKPVHQSKIIQGYDENGNPTPVWTDHVLTGAGSFLSNGNDMVKFVKANLNERASPISKSLLATHHQQFGGETGLGWILPSHIDKILGNENIVWHSGMSGGYSSFIALDKVNNYGLFVLTNKSIDATKIGMKLTVKVRTQSWKK